MGRGLGFHGVELLRATVWAASHPEEGRNTWKTRTSTFARHAHGPCIVSRAVLTHDTKPAHADVDIFEEASEAESRLVVPALQLRQLRRPASLLTDPNAKHAVQLRCFEVGACSKLVLSGCQVVATGCQDSLNFIKTVLGQCYFPIPVASAEFHSVFQRPLPSDPGKEGTSSSTASDGFCLTTCPIFPRRQLPHLELLRSFLKGESCKKPLLKSEKIIEWAMDAAYKSVVKGKYSCAQRRDQRLQCKHVHQNCVESIVVR